MRRSSINPKELKLESINVPSSFKATEKPKKSVIMRGISNSTKHSDKRTNFLNRKFHEMFAYSKSTTNGSFNQKNSRDLYRIITDNKNQDRFFKMLKKTEDNEKKRKNALIRSTVLYNDVKMFGQANDMNARVMKRIKNIHCMENKIQENCRFNVKLKNKYISTMKSIECHKLKHMQEKYTKLKKSIKYRQEQSKNKGTKNVKIFNKFGDLKKFQKKLVDQQNVLQIVQQYHKRKKTSFF